MNEDTVDFEQPLRSVAGGRLVCPNCFEHLDAHRLDCTYPVWY